MLFAVTVFNFFSRYQCCKSLIACSVWLLIIGIFSVVLDVLAVPYPQKAIRLVVGFPPGGGNDAMARLFGQRISERVGKAVVIDNRPGAGGNLAAELVARATPDGYTLMVVSSSHPIQGLLKAHLPYDPIRDFSSVAQLVHYRSVLVATPNLGVHQVRDLLQLAKSKPGQINFVSPGSGTGAHLAGELFRYITGLNIVHIPYKGTGQAIIDLVAGRVELMFAPSLTVFPHVQAGRLRALGMTSATRSRIMADLPTLAEAGVKGYEFGAWYGILGPPRLPNEVTTKIYAEVQASLATAELKERLFTEDLEPAQANANQLDTIRQSELLKWTKIVRQLNLKFD